MSQLWLNSDTALSATLRNKVGCRRIALFISVPLGAPEIALPVRIGNRGDQSLGKTPEVAALGDEPAPVAERSLRLAWLVATVLILGALQSLAAPSQTTKANGTGLGLSVAHQIVSQHKGMLTIVRNSSQGVTVRVSLPLR